MEGADCNMGATIYMFVENSYFSNFLLTIHFHQPVYHLPSLIVRFTLFVAPLVMCRVQLQRPLLRALEYGGGVGRGRA